ncbi:MAG: hypothetical protein M0005_17050 [Actinomycetota bacterium]|nr:hypothetical protein [Actinomycetota bacterium]
MRTKPAGVPPERPGGSGSWGWSAGLVGSLAVLAGLLGGCSPSATYLGTAGQGFYYKVPKHWDTFSSTALHNLGLPTTAQASQLQAQGASYPVYANFVTGVKHLGKQGISGPHPWAFGLVMNLASTDQAGLSLSSLQDEVFNVSGASQAGALVRPLFPSKVVVKGALRGTRVAYEINAGASSLAFEQEALVNSPTNKVWVLVAGCSPSCFQAHRRLINSIISTFTVTGYGG